MLGPPGTGKSMVVGQFPLATPLQAATDQNLTGALSEAYSMPLLHLTPKELEVDDPRSDERLTRYFKLAESWNALVFLDDCDVYLQASVELASVNPLLPSLIPSRNQIRGFPSGTLSLLVRRVH